MEHDRASELVREVVEAHGGAALWARLEALEAEISAWGFLFPAKRRRPLRHVRVWASTREPHFMFHDTPRPGLRSELLGAEEVRILDERGVVESRRQPRLAFRSLRRQFAWDDLDFTYFGSYATWNYLLTPFLFLRPGFRFELLEPRESATGLLSRLKVTFPSDLPTHCTTQTVGL